MQIMPKMLARMEMERQATTSFMVGRQIHSSSGAEVALQARKAAANSVPPPHSHNVRIQQQALRGGAVSSLADAPINTKMALTKLT